MTKKIYKINKLCGCVCGTASILLAWIVKSAVRSPYLLLHQTDSFPLLPPLWLLGFLWFGGFFLMGWVVGCELSSRENPCPSKVKRYQCALLIVLSATITFAWYLLLFGLGALFFSWCLLILSVVFEIFAGLRLMTVSGKGSCLIWLVTASHLWISIMQIMVMLHI